MADTYLPTASDDAQRAQLMQRLFWTASDLFAGTDTSLRYDTTQVRADGALGPNGAAVSYGVGENGEIYVRGSAGAQVGTTKVTGSGAAASVGGIVLTPGLLMLAGLAFLLLRK